MDNEKSIYEVAIEASQGLYGTGHERDSMIESYGYNPRRVQKIINRGLKYGFSEYENLILGAARAKVAKVEYDGKRLYYTKKQDLAKQVKELFESEKYSKLKKKQKYVTYYTTNSKGKEVKKKMTYSDAVDYLKKHPVETNNDNNESWEQGSDTGTGDGSGNNNSGGGSSKEEVEEPVLDSPEAPKPSGRGVNNPIPNITFYIKNMLNEKIIYLPVYPEELSESFSTNYSQTELNGRSAPYQTYGGNEARTMSLPVTLHQDLCDETTGDLHMIVRYLKQLVYPKYNGSIVIPPYCFLKFGNMLNCYAIMDSIDFNWSETIIEESKYFSKCEVNFSFQELRKNSLPTVDNVFKNGRDIDT